LPSLMVEDIAAGPAGEIWIGTYDNGMVRVQNGQWTLYPYPASVMLYHFAVTPAGDLWCATSAGLYKFSNQTFTWINNPLTGSTWDVKIFPNGRLLLASNQPHI
jgi:ligand-binding sensor domain-containing protein